MTTSNLGDFGMRELGILAKTLEAYAKGEFYHPHWVSVNVQPMMNTNSGFVFLTDDNYNVLMLNGDKLEPFFILPYSGLMGFLEDFSENQYEYDRQDWEYLEDIRKEIA